MRVRLPLPHSEKVVGSIPSYRSPVSVELAGYVPRVCVFSPGTPVSLGLIRSGSVYEAAASSARNVLLLSPDAQCLHLLEDLVRNAHVIYYSTMLI